MKNHYQINEFRVKLEKQQNGYKLFLLVQLVHLGIQKHMQTKYSKQEVTIQF